MAKCINCNNEFDSKRDSAKYCSGACRVYHSRSKIKPLTEDGIVLDEPVADEVFEFRVRDVREKDGLNPTIRHASVYYNVPLCAVPIYKKNYPKMPDYMDGRQYFLWWKNGFKVNDKDQPVIFNPLPKYEKIEYYQAGDNSRRWGA